MIQKNTTDNSTENRQGDVISKMENVLKNISNHLGLQVDYFAICACALEFLEAVLGKDCDFPVNIEKIVKSVGLEIVYQPLNHTSVPKRLHRIAGKIIKRQSRLTGDLRSVILIDENSTRKEQRYTLAHELTHYLMHYSDQHFRSEFRVMPMLFKNKEEMIADIFSIFLLIPLPIFLKEFSTYIGVAGDVPVNTSEWLQYLSTIAAVPYEDVAIGYQNIRYVSSIFYQSTDLDTLLCEYDESQEVICSIVKKQWNNIKPFFSDEKIKQLFC